MYCLILSQRPSEVLPDVQDVPPAAVEPLPDGAYD